MRSSTWDVVPTHTLIVDLLGGKGATDSKKLYKAAKKEIKDLSWREFNITLMRLEIHGLIHVYTTTKDQRMVELVKKEE